MPRRHLFAILAASLLIAGGCGARLTKAQMDALDSNGSGGGAVAAGSPSGAGGGSGAGSSGGSVLGRGAGGGAGGSRAGGTGSGTGSSTGHGGGATGGRGGTSTGGGGTTPVVQAGNPLAGPGGTVCAPNAAGSGPGVTARTITIGNITTVNGPVPGLFAGARYGTQAVADYINSLGGLCGRQVVVNSEDDQFDQATDQNEASSMANNVLAFVGSFSLQDAGIPAGAPGVPDLGEALSAQRFDASTNFSPQPQAPGYSTGAFQYFKSSPKYQAATQHMALLVENTPQTATQGKYLQQAMLSIGYHFVFVDTNLQPTDPTFNGDVEKMKQSGVTGVAFEATSAIIGQLANSMYQAGMNIVLGNYSPPAYDPAYIQNAGPGTAGTVLSQSLALYEGEDAAAIPMVATFDQWYSRVNPGQTPDIYALYGWMSGIMLAQALNSAGSATRAALNAGLHHLTTFTADGLSAPGNPVSKTPPSCWLLIDVQNNKFVRDPATPSGFRCSPSGYFHSS